MASPIASTASAPVKSYPSGVTTSEPPADLDDDALMELVKNGDAEAYRRVVARHVDRAYGLALRILKHPADAEDVTQDAFVKVWLHRQRWESGRAKFSTWLYRVIVNRCIDLRRAPGTTGLEEADEPLDESEDSLSRLHRQEVYGHLEIAIGRLPAQQRTALTLSYHEEMSNAEVAEIMGLTVLAVESLLKRARQRLRELLKRSEADIRRLFITG